MARKLGPKGPSMKNNKAHPLKVITPPWDGKGWQHDSLRRGDHEAKGYFQHFSTEELFEMLRLTRSVSQRLSEVHCICRHVHDRSTNSTP